MKASELAELAAFDAVARLRSFRRAAGERGVTPSAISHAVTRLEARLGIRLLQRTTRNVSLTEAGARLLQQLSPAFTGIGLAVDTLNDFRDTPFGTVRINAPNSIASFVLGPVLEPILRTNPQLQLEVLATDRLVDIVEEGFDAGIRLGESLRDGMTAVRIKPRLRLVVVGSPGYLAAHGTLRKPDDLRGHTCIRNLYPSGSPYPWSFQRRGKAVDVMPAGPLSSDDHELMIQAALAGVALAYVWEDRARPHLEAGRLHLCLDEWCAPEDPLFLYYPTRKYISAGLRVVIGALRG